MKIPRRRFLMHTLAGAPRASCPVSPWRSISRPGRSASSCRSPGGGLDFVARLTGEYLSRSIGQQVYIENKLGAGGMIGIETAAKSAPDGYSVLVTNDNVASAPHVLSVNTDYVKVFCRSSSCRGRRWCWRSTTALRQNRWTTSSRPPRRGRA